MKHRIVCIANCCGVFVQGISLPKWILKAGVTMWTIYRSSLVVLDKTGPVILIALIAHHTPTLTSNNDTSWIDMGKLLFWELMYQLRRKQLLPRNRVILRSAFYFHVTVHRNKFLFNKTNRRTDFSNLFLSSWSSRWRCTPRGSV